MSEVQTHDGYTAIRDLQGRWVFGIAPALANLPTSLVPNGALAYVGGSTKRLYNFDGATLAWVALTTTLDDLTITDDLTVTDALLVSGLLTAAGGVAGDVVGNVTGDLTGQVIHNDNVRSKRIRVTLAQLAAGFTLLAAVPGFGYRIIDFTMIAVGGALGTATSIEIEGNQAGAVDLFSVAAAQLTRSAVNRPGLAGTTVLADGASFAVCSDNTAVTISATGVPDTLTDVDVILTYTLET